MAPDREKGFWHTASADRRTGCDSIGVVIAASRGIQSAFAFDLRRRYGAGRAFLSLWRTRSGLQCESDAHWPDVQYGFNANDFFRLHLLPVERAESLSDSAENCLGESAGLRERGPARNARAPVSAPVSAGCVYSAGVLLYSAARDRTAAVPQQGCQLGRPACWSLAP